MELRAAHVKRKEMKTMKKTEEMNIKRSTEVDDAREFAELCGKLSPNERQQVKSIIIGIQIAKAANPEAVTA